MSLDSLLYTTKHALGVMNLKNGTSPVTIPFDTGSSPIDPLFIDSEHILAIRADRYVCVVNVKTGHTKQQSHCPEPIKAMTLSHSKTYFFAGTSSGKLYTWHFPSGELINVIDAHYKAISMVKCNDDDSLIFTAGFDGSCHVWDIFSLLDYSHNSAAAQSSTQQTTGAASMASLAQFSQRPTPRLKYSSHSMPITAMHLTTSVGNGGKFFTSSLDRHVVEYSLESNEVRNIWSLPSPVVKLCTNPTYTEIYAGCANGMIYSIPLYDETSFTMHNTMHGASATDRPMVHTSLTAQQQQQSRNNNKVANFKTFSAHSGLITSLHVSIQGTHLISTSTDGSVIVWSLAQRQPAQQYFLSASNPTPIINAVAHYDTQSSLKLHDDFLRKKQFPVLSRELTLTRPLTSFNTGMEKIAGLQSIAFVPQPTNTFNFTPMGSAQHYYEDHLLALIDADNNNITQTSVQQQQQQQQQSSTNGNNNNNTKNTNNKQNNKMQDSEEEQDEDDEEEKAKQAELLTEKAKEIKQLEAEVKKWKAVATDLYKKQKK